MKLNNEQLWLDFQRGNSDALTKIYHLFADELFTYGLKIVNDEQLVKDCIQDVFVKLIDKRKSIRLTSNIHLYLFKSIRNKLYEECRTKNRKQSILSHSIEFSSFEEKHPEQLIIETEERNEIQRKLVSTLNTMTNRQKEIIYLKYTKGLNYDEIAEILAIDKASARTLVYRTLKSLKKALQENAFIFMHIF